MHMASAGIGRASAWAAHPAASAPTWATILALVAFVVTVVVGIVFALISSWQPPQSGGDNGGWGRGGGPRRPRPSGDQSPGGDPAWWPDFERQFAAYVAKSGASAWQTRTRRRDHPVLDAAPATA